MNDSPGFWSKLANELVNCAQLVLTPNHLDKWRETCSRSQNSHQTLLKMKCLVSTFKFLINSCTGCGSRVDAWENLFFFVLWWLSILRWSTLRLLESRSLTLISVTQVSEGFWWSSVRPCWSLINWSLWCQAHGYALHFVFAPYKSPAP